MADGSTDKDSTARFSDRVADYVRYRPGYPCQLLDVLAEAGVLVPQSVVADLGSGTGISARLFLEAGHTVFGVESNAAMREAAERDLASLTNFHSLEGTAEETTLPAGSLDLIFAAQAFHWFDVEACRAEWQRILKPAPSPQGLALVWNSRRTDATPFLKGYEALLHQHGTDYGKVNHQKLDYEALRSLFDPATYQRLSLDNHQDLDQEGFFGRVFSSSYTPGPGEPGREEMEAALDRLFQAHQQNGQVRWEYEVEVHVGRAATVD